MSDATGLTDKIIEDAIALINKQPQQPMPQLVCFSSPAGKSVGKYAFQADGIHVDGSASPAMCGIIGEACNQKAVRVIGWLDGNGSFPVCAHHAAAMFGT